MKGIYSRKEVDELLLDDEITIEEAGFMWGYLSEGESF